MITGFEAAQVLKDAWQPLDMTVQNQVMRAVSQEPEKLMQYLDLLQRNMNCTSTERILCTIVRGLIFQLTMVAEPVVAVPVVKPPVEATTFFERLLPGAIKPESGSAKPQE